MAGSECIDLLEKERNLNEVKDRLNDWKEIIVFLNAVMAWEKDWYPAIIVASVTSLYLYVWLMNCSVVNIIWMFGLCATMLDCFVCGPFQKILPPNSWNRDKEHTYTFICESLTDLCQTLKLYVERFFKLRETNSKLFHSVLTLLFLSFLYVGTTFNNMFVSYITVLVILLFPGFKIRSEFIEENLQKYTDVMLSYLWSNQSKIATS